MHVIKDHLRITTYYILKGYFGTSTNVWCPHIQMSVLIGSTLYTYIYFCTIHKFVIDTSYVYGVCMYILTHWLVNIVRIIITQFDPDSRENVIPCRPRFILQPLLKHLITADIVQTQTVLLNVFETSVENAKPHTQF